MNIQEIKEQLQKPKTYFTVKGYNSYQAGPDGEYGDYPTKFHTSGNEKEGTVSIYKGYMGLSGMNVRKFGPTCITLYDYNMLGKKTVGKIKYADVTILENEKEV